MATAQGHAHRGPPPRVWGEQRQQRKMQTRIRSTPTRVGRTARHRGFGRTLPVHPHACGENTPTSAHPQGVPVHPHACGENAFVRTETGGFNRSTPTRVGRTRWLDRLQLDHVRSTPTRVGRTSSSRPASISSTVHPHACGENLPQTPDSGLPLGPPPRVWGERSPVT